MSAIQQFCNHFEEIRVQAREVTEELNYEQFNWRPGADQWSIEECLAHLLSSGNERLKAIEAGIELGKSRGLAATGAFRPGPIERFVIRHTEPPVKGKGKTPKRFRPLHDQPMTGVLPSFDHLQTQLILQAKRAEGLDLSRIKIATPLASFLRMSLGATFAQVAAHERRHLEQARRVRKALPR
jgi:hypothetical protein